MSGWSTDGLRAGLVTQAVVTLLFSASPGMGTDGRWLAIQLVLAAGAGAAAWLAAPGNPTARTVGLGYEGLALAAGAVGMLGHHYIPGTLIGIKVLVGLLSHDTGTGAAAAGLGTGTSTAATAATVAAPALVPAMSWAPAEPAARFAAPVPPAPMPPAPVQAEPVPVALGAVPTPPPAQLPVDAPVIPEQAAPAPPAPAPPAPAPPAPVGPPVAAMALDVLPARRGRR